MRNLLHLIQIILDCVNYIFSESLTYFSIFEVSPDKPKFSIFDRKKVGQRPNEIYLLNKLCSHHYSANHLR